MQERLEYGIEYVRGGTCPVHELIEVPVGYPKCPDHPIWLGVFEGSWYDIGKQFGESEGVCRYITHVFDYWFGLVSKGVAFLRGTGVDSALSLGTVPKGFTLDDIRSILRTVEEQVNLYEPSFIQAMKGEAEGAAPALAKSKYASILTDYEKVLFLNFRSFFLLNATTYEHDCSCIALLPPATADGKVIVGRNSQIGLDMGNYCVAYAAVPPAPAHRFMTNTFPGVLFGLGVVSDTPLHASRTAGIGSARPGIGEDFLVAKGAVFGNSVEEATDLIVHGSEAYRKATGRKTTLRANPITVTIVDAETARVLEATTRHWAVRFPGEFGEKDFIVVTNHYLCQYSYNEDDVRTDVPMYDESVCNRFGGCKQETAPQLKNKVFAGYETEELVIPEPGTCTRYWAVYWAAMYNHGKVDLKMLQGPSFLGSHYWYDINGKKIEYQIDSVTGVWTSVYYLYAHSTVEGTSGGYPEKYKNEIPSSLISVPGENTSYWELYKPTMWEGKWEQVTFRRDSSRKGIC